MPKALLAEFTVLPGAEARVAELVTDLAGQVRERTEHPSTRNCAT